MTTEFPKSDWKLLCRLQPTILERYCQRVLDELQPIASDSSWTASQRYDGIFQLLTERHKEAAWAFSDLPPSRALDTLFAFRFLGLLPDVELAQFTEETAGLIRRHCDPPRA